MVRDGKDASLGLGRENADISSLTLFPISKEGK